MLRAARTDSPKPGHAGYWGGARRGFYLAWKAHPDALSRQVEAGKTAGCAFPGRVKQAIENAVGKA